MRTVSLLPSRINDLNKPLLQALQPDLILTRELCIDHSAIRPRALEARVARGQHRATQLAGVLSPTAGPIDRAMLEQHNRQRRLNLVHFNLR